MRQSWLSGWSVDYLYQTLLSSALLTSILLDPATPFMAPLTKYIGCSEVCSDLAVLYHEENFPGIDCKISVLLKQTESPSITYVLGGTKWNRYPTAIN